MSQNEKADVIETISAQQRESKKESTKQFDQTLAPVTSTSAATGFSGLVASTTPTVAGDSRPNAETTSPVVNPALQVKDY